MILWLSEPNEARYHGISNWITTIKDEVRTKLRALEVFIRARERRSPIRLTRASIHEAVHVAALRGGAAPVDAADGPEDATSPCGPTPRGVFD